MVLNGLNDFWNQSVWLSHPCLILYLFLLHFCFKAFILVLLPMHYDLYRDICSDCILWPGSILASLPWKKEKERKELSFGYNWCCISLSKCPHTICWMVGYWSMHQTHSLKMLENVALTLYLFFKLSGPLKSIACWVPFLWLSQSFGSWLILVICSGGNHRGDYKKWFWSSDCVCISNGYGSGSIYVEIISSDPSSKGCLGLTL